MSLFDEIMDRATPMRRTVPILLNGEIRTKIEKLEARIAAAQPKSNDTRLGTTRTAATVTALQTELDGLYSEAEASTLHIRIEGLPGTSWRALLAAHPPRKLEDGKINPEDAGLGCNEETFRRPVVEATIRGHERGGELHAMDEEQVGQLLAWVSDVQMDRLVTAAVRVNRMDDAVPLRRPLSTIPPSDDE